MPTPPVPRPAPAGGAPLALALLLAPAWIAWPGPGGPLVGLPAAVEPTAAGAAALATLPAALIVATGRARIAGLAAPLLLAAVLLVAVASHLARPGSDTLEASRALLTLATALAALCGGAALGERGVRVLVRGAVVVSLFLTASALAWRLVEPARLFAGVLGNAGELASAALPGAACGAALAACGRTPRWRRLGAFAAALLLAHAALSGQRAGALALALALGALAVLRPRGAGARRAARAVAGAWAAAGVLVVLLAGALDRTGLTSLAEPPAADATAAGGVDAPVDAAPAGTSGARVRLLVARRTLALIADRPLLGVGPGQFATEFPRWRDPAEIEVSTLGRRIGETTEVEHPHDDWLLGVAEHGLAGGAPWIALLLLALVRAARGLARAGPAVAAAGAAALAVLADAAVNGPLLYEPASAALAWALLGVVTAPAHDAAAPETLPRRALARAVPALAALALLVGAPRATDLVAHGRALARWTALPIDPRTSSVDAMAASRVVAGALRHAPDSVTALSLQARVARGSGGDPRPAYERILALRPHRFEALMNLGFAEARDGKPDAARVLWERALALDPAHPGLRRNLARLELGAGNAERGLAHVAALADAGRLDAAWARELGAWLLARGQAREAFGLLARVDPALGGPAGPATGEDAWLAATEARTAGDERLADGLESHAHRLWARDHAASGRPGDAVRSYRQALRAARLAGADAPRVPLELAAALALDGRAAEAAEVARDLDVRASDRAALPAWARDALADAGLLAD